MADKHSFEVDYKDLCNSESIYIYIYLTFSKLFGRKLILKILNQVIQEKLPEFVNEFDQRPEFYLNCLGLAMHQV